MDTSDSDDELDCYGILGLQRDALKTEVKKAYRKVALSCHPDKVQPSERTAAEARFKKVSRAYEILSDDNKRQLYNKYGMSAFDASQGGSNSMSGPNLEDIFEQLFNDGRLSPKEKKGRNVVEDYEVALEELYKGKTTHFTSTRNVICASCKGTGGKDRAKSHSCSACKGTGKTISVTNMGGLLTQQWTTCGVCSGKGSLYKVSDRCRKCKGARIVESKKVLELNIPKGALTGDNIVLPGEADQLPDQKPGDIVFKLVEVPHPVFKRSGSDLMADLVIDLSEALTGFDRTVLTHLDGRGLRMKVKQPKGMVLRPSQTLKVTGEGMPIKDSEMKGDLYLVVQVQFPDDGWFKDESAVETIRNALPKNSIEEIKVDDNAVNEVDFQEASMDDFGGDTSWEADDDDDDGDHDTAEAQCSHQ